MGHFYMPDGTPFYEVENKSRGGMRPATLRDARKVGAMPSVTAIIGVAAAPGLENWKIEQGILAALTNPDITPDMPIREIMSIVKKDAMEQAKQAADAGTAIHDAIENHFNGRSIPAEHRATVDAVVAALDKHCGKQDWKAESWFCAEEGFGGKIDLISDEWVIDFKTKEGDVSDQKAWPNQLMQLAAYDYGTSGKQTRRLANIMVSRDIPGSVKFIEWNDREEHHRALHKFMCLLGYWQTEKNYFPQEKAA